MAEVVLHGLVVEAPFDLAGGRTSSGRPDVLIELARSDRKLTADHARQSEALVWVDDARRRQRYGLFAVSGGGWHMQFSGTAMFVIDRSVSRITVYLESGIPAGTVQTLLSGPVMTAVVLLRGGGVVHASALWTEGGVIALCGASGSGKSTLATVLHSHTTRFYADDALALKIGPGEVLAMRGALRSRLRARLSSADAVSQSVGVSHDARVLYEHDAAGVPSHAPLRALVFPRLSPAFAAPRTTRLPAHQVAVSLGCALDGVQSGRLKSSHFQLVGGVADRVPGFLLDVPWQQRPAGSDIEVDLDAIRVELRRVVHD